MDHGLEAPLVKQCAGQAPSFTPNSHKSPMGVFVTVAWPPRGAALVPQPPPRARGTAGVLVQSRGGCVCGSGNNYRSW